MSLQDEHVSNICEQLLRNDPAVVEAEPCVVVNIRDRPDTRNRKLQEYLLALKHNTVVTTITLGLNPFFWDEYGYHETEEMTIDRLQPLLYFLQRCSSLRHVKIRQPYIPTTPSRMRILQLIVDATSKNPSVHSFDSDVHFFSPELLTSFLSTKQDLQRLHIAIDIEHTRKDIVERAARAFGVLAALQDLSIKATDFLPFLQTLPFSSLLSQLTLAMGGLFVIAPNISRLPGVCKSLRKLTDVSLKGIRIEIEQWRHLLSGIQSNPNISSLSFDRCNFTREVAELFLEDMTSNKVLQQQIHKLNLSRCRDGNLFIFPYASVATMLRSSLLRHIVLDTRTLFEPGDIDLREFFEVLSAGNSVVSLRSMELIISGQNVGAMQHISLFLPTTVHLGRLKIQTNLPNGQRRRLQVPLAFWSSLRSNGSLCSVEILDVRERPTLSKRVKRYSQACTRRNRRLPKALRTVFGDKSKPNVANDASLSNRFPTLSVSAMQAPKMAPNNVLIGLLASLEAFAPAAKRSDAKRVAP